MLRHKSVSEELEAPKRISVANGFYGKFDEKSRY